MSTEDRGFASLTSAARRAIASKGGKAAHKAGTAHVWTTEQARAAGSKGGATAARNRASRRALEAQNETAGVQPAAETVTGMWHKAE